MNIKSLYRVVSCSQEEAVGLAALSAGLLFPKRPPLREPEPADVPVAAAVVLPVPAPGNKLPPPPLAPVEAPVPGAKGLAPEAAGGFGKPNRGPEIDR